MREKVSNKEIKLEQRSHVKNYFFTYLLTLSNPITLLSFAAIFGGISLGDLTNGFS